MQFTIRQREFIFTDERPFASCHASTLVVLPNQEILAAWFGGSEEGADDVAIWCSRRSQGKWSPPICIADEEGLPHWNPVLFSAPDGRIFLFYKVGKQIPSWQTRVMISEDQGETWSAPRELVPGDRGGRGPVKNKPIVAFDGTWLAPASIEGDRWDAFVDRSRDQGATWQQSSLVPLARPGTGETAEDQPLVTGKGVIQPTLWQSQPGRVHMLLRSTEGRIFRSDSNDNGQSWSRAYPIDMPNNNSGIDLAQTPQGYLALAYNPVGENWGARTPLVVAGSSDNGITWPAMITLEEDEGEFSYPAIVATQDGIYLTYTWNRTRIAFCELSLD
ncbi:MAG: exo-alpha-sialidase [Firmicutes bacterium]|nr:exo-alpha-sialidase [Bacillota bacterium]